METCKAESAAVVILDIGIWEGENVELTGRADFNDGLAARAKLVRLNARGEAMCGQTEWAGGRDFRMASVE